MNVTIEEVNSIKRKLTVELPEEDARKTWRKFLDTYARKARLKGFRPGKAPRDMVAKAYAEEIRREVVEELVSEAVPAALKEHDLTPMGAPILENVDYQDNLPLKFSVLVELKPVFESPDWRGLTLQRRKSRVNDEMVGKKLEELRRSLATIKKIEDDRPLARGDLASVIYQAFNEEGVELPKYGGGPFNVELVESRRLVPGFVDGLVGMKAGETKEIPVTLPEDADDRKMAGRPLKLLTTVRELKVRELPELDDEFAKDLGLDGVETLAALKERLAKDLLKEESDRADRLFNQQMTKALADLVSIDVPSSMVEREIRNRIQSLRDNFARNGLDFKKIGVDAASLRERFRPQAEKSVTAALVLDQIGQENQVDISDEEIEAELAQMSRDYGQSVESLRDYYKTRGLMDTLREGLKISKTLDLIKAQAVIEEVERLDAPGHDPLGEDDPATLGAALSGEAGEADDNGEV
ncbi:MAG: trigger factor [Candidatus Adiutrix sp.]|jgi:trigger factor|nr:trigger factor [Candidatus Adiutrix sp.]